MVSSWLWPISVFDGIRNPNNDEINYYYPTQDLVTGPDIIFLGSKNDYFQDMSLEMKNHFLMYISQGLLGINYVRKMSKQLGNSPDTVKLIEEYGADSVRVGLMLNKEQ